MIWFFLPLNLNDEMLHINPNRKRSGISYHNPPIKAHWSSKLILPKLFITRANLILTQPRKSDYVSFDGPFKYNHGNFSLQLSLCALTKPSWHSKLRRSKKRVSGWARFDQLKQASVEHRDGCSIAGQALVGVVSCQRRWSCRRRYYDRVPNAAFRRVNNLYCLW